MSVACSKTTKLQLLCAEAEAEAEQIEKELKGGADGDAELRRACAELIAARLCQIQGDADVPTLRGKVIRIICKLPFATRHGWDKLGYLEQPLGDQFAGHCNWADKRLSGFWTARVPFETLIGLGHLFCLSSYRWGGIKKDKCTDSREIALPSNYGWYLDEIGDAKAGWMDFITHGCREEEIGAAIALMGPFYALFPVIPQYMTSTGATKQAVDTAMSRGWIFQESASVVLDPEVVRCFLQGISGSGTRPTADGLDMLLTIASRRSCLQKVAAALISWCRGLHGTEIDSLLCEEIIHECWVSYRTQSSLQSLVETANISELTSRFLKMFSCGGKQAVMTGAKIMEQMQQRLLWLLVIPRP